MSTDAPLLLPRAYYTDTVEGFLTSTHESILGILTSNSEAAVEPAQRNAWLAQVTILKTALVGTTGRLFLEFNIPRMGRRIDTVLIVGPAIIVIEFKIGEKVFYREDTDQVWDYALDLKNFHEASHHAPILPILVATAADVSEQTIQTPYEDLVYPPVRANASTLRSVVDLAVRELSGITLDGMAWSLAPYHPTPTIIQAAQSLYAQHSVEAIARHDAGKRNLRVTSARSSGNGHLCAAWRAM